MSQCVGVKKDGVRCSVMVIGEGQTLRCKVHTKTLEKSGPNQVRRDEMKYTHARMNNEIYTRFNDILHGLEAAEYERQIRARSAAIREEEIRYQLDLHSLEERITQETELNGGVNADHQFIERRMQRMRLLRAQLHERWRLRNIGLRQEARQQPPEGGELAQLAHDRQNVHTSVVVQKVKEAVERILQIPVPPEYQSETLKTSGEIILACRLSKQAAWQMMSKYCNDEDIYELGFGIYARVLNSVWQYIKASPDSEDLKKILASEMQDNIGMCAQGNLSRLCNILSGYMEGLAMDTKSKNELIGERLASLIEIDDTEQRVAAGVHILQELEVPFEERDTWLQPLIDV